MTVAFMILLMGSWTAAERMKMQKARSVRFWRRVNADTHLVTEVNGKPTAKIMYFNGLSRTRTNGDIAYLYNPYIQDNLAFSLQMQIASEQYYPGFARHIYLKAYRYNLHLLPKSLLIEAGAQTNTVEEMKNAMEVLERTLKRVLTE